VSFISLYIVGASSELPLRIRTRPLRLLTLFFFADTAAYSRTTSLPAVGIVLPDSGPPHSTSPECLILPQPSGAPSFYADPVTRGPLVNSSDSVGCPHSIPNHACSCSISERRFFCKNPLYLNVEYEESISLHISLKVFVGISSSPFFCESPDPPNITP